MRRCPNDVPELGCAQDVPEKKRATQKGAVGVVGVPWDVPLMTSSPESYIRTLSASGERRYRRREKGAIGVGWAHKTSHRKALSASGKGAIGVGSTEAPLEAISRNYRAKLAHDDLDSVIQEFTQ